MPKERTISEEEVKQKIDKVFREILQENHMALWSPAQMLEMLRDMKLSPEEKIVEGMTLGMTIGLESPGAYLANRIETPEQLDETLKTMRRLGAKWPTMLRTGLKAAADTLARRGGPGCNTILTKEEAAIICDQIAAFIRQKHSVRKSLKMASELCPKLFGGKTASPRTLATLWGKRDEYKTE